MALSRRTILVASGGSLLEAIGFRSSAGAASAEPSADAPAPALRKLTLTAAPRSPEGGTAAAPGRMSYDAGSSGPVVRVRRGTTIEVTLTNALTVPTSLQWHGLRGASAEVGTIEGDATVAPGGSLTQTIRATESGLFWFHPAPRPGETDQTAAGLRGVLVVEEDVPPAADKDLVLVIEDAADGGPGLRLNGVAPGKETVPSGSRLRLRLLNATAARNLLVGIDGAHPKVVSIDGQPSSLFPPLRDTVPLGPGARVELMVDAPAEAGARVAAVVRTPISAEGPRPPDAPLWEGTTAGEPRPALPPVAPLPPNPALPAAIPLERSVRAKLTLEAVADAKPGAAAWRLNGTAATALPTQPLFSVPRGGAVTVSFDNRSALPIPMRVHGQAMRLLHAKDDGWEPYWRDSVILPPGTVTLVAFVADTPGRWLVDSAVAEQSRTGLRTWFLVTGGPA